MVSQFSGKYFEDWPPSEIYHYASCDSYEESREGAHVEKALKLEDHRARLTRTKAPKYCELTDSGIPFFHLSIISLCNDSDIHIVSNNAMYTVSKLAQHLFSYSPFGTRHFVVFDTS